MRKLLFAFAVICLPLLLTNCSGVETDAEEPADAFVGEYTTVDTYFITWGGDSKNSQLTSKFMLLKVDSDRVRMIGEWNTTGTVSGNSIVLDPTVYTDSDGYVNYTFSPGTLYGNTLKFSYSGSGQMRFTNGVSYPYNVSGNIVATMK